jgi:hypothetical protein
VRDVNEGRGEPPVELGDLGAHVDAQFRIEVGQRLVHQEHARLAHHGPPEGDALLLATGQLPRLARQQFLDTQNASDLACRIADFRFDSPRSRMQVAHTGSRRKALSRLRRNGMAMLSSTERCG